MREIFKSFKDELDEIRITIKPSQNPSVNANVSVYATTCTGYEFEVFDRALIFDLDCEDEEDEGVLEDLWWDTLYSMIYQDIEEAFGLECNFTKYAQKNEIKVVDDCWL